MNNKTIKLLEVMDALSTIEILLERACTVANDQNEGYFSLNPDDERTAVILQCKYRAASTRHDVIQEIANSALEQITALTAALDMKLSELGKEQETA